ncbi:glycosyltransferase family 4 protein [Candidatus Gracilibacteria bacterium]|nr:glycosyltransferase family 4 protein [Candidatus Gracilibacteria bacterium]
MPSRKIKKSRKNRIAILHYSYPPVVGGVEFVMEGHANLLAEMGFPVKIITATGGEENSNPNIEIAKISEIDSSNPVIKKCFQKDGSIKKTEFELAKKLLKKKLAKSLSGVSKCFVHNIMTMHFNTVLTAAIFDLMDELKNIKFIVWCHDASLINLDYHFRLKNEYPLNLLGKINRKAKYVTISKERQKQIAELFGVKKNLIKSVPNGIDIKKLLNIDSEIWKFASDFGFFEKDIIALFPTRILERKNIEKGIDIICELKNLGLKVSYVITGMPDPHNKATAKYYDFLRKYIKKKKVEKDVIFVADTKQSDGSKFKIDLNKLRSLYNLCDILLMPSKQEGFGLPLLEAGIFRMPIFCSNVSPLPDIFAENANYFELKESPAKIAKHIASVCDNDSAFKNFKKVMLDYSWPSIYKKHIHKLISQK